MLFESIDRLFTEGHKARIELCTTLLRKVVPVWVVLTVEAEEICVGERAKISLLGSGASRQARRHNARACCSQWIKYLRLAIHSPSHQPSHG